MFVVCGESLIDLVQDPAGAGGQIHMTAHAGGSPYNCAIALAKLGNDCGYMCPISRDGFGDYLKKPLDVAGVTLLLEERVFAPSTLAVVTLNEKGQAQYEFYRGADRAFTREGLLKALPEKTHLLQVGGFCPIEPEDAAAWLDVVHAASARGAVISMDPNVRPTLLEDPEGYRARLSAFLDQVHLVKVSDEDLAWLDPDKSIEQHAAELLARPNCELVVVTLGENGSRAFTAAGDGRADIYRPEVFGDTVGAGDSLMAGILSRLSERGDLQPGRLGSLDATALSEVLRFGAVVAGLNCAHMGCNPPTRQEVDAALDR